MKRIKEFFKRWYAHLYMRNIGGVGVLPIRAEIGGKLCYLKVNYDLHSRKWCCMYEYEHEGEMLVALMLERKHYTEAIMDMVKKLIKKGVI